MSSQFNSQEHLEIPEIKLITICILAVIGTFVYLLAVSPLYKAWKKISK
jgi:hypothetical protein